MAIRFFYHDPLDFPNNGGSFMVCEASYETKRTGPTTIELTINTKFTARKTSLEVREYNVDYDHKRDGAYETISEKIVGGKEWEFTRKFTYTVTKESGFISFWYSAYYNKDGNAVDISGYETTINAWYPGYITVAIPSKPVITNIRTNQFSFSWEVLEDGGEYPTLHTEIYNHPDYPNQWKALEDINGYGYISSGTVTGLTRYTNYKLRAYVTNSAGGNRSEEVSFFTMPEDPKFSTILLTNKKADSVNYSWSAIDNGGKALTTYKTQIVNGQYGEWTDWKVSSDTSACSGTITDLLHNTLYEIRAYASNGLSEAYSSSIEFTTLGNGPNITEFRAQSIDSHEITMIYSAEYDRNAVFDHYFIQYREFGETEWIQLPMSTRIVSGVKSCQRYEFRILITDSWNRTTTSNIVDVYTSADIFTPDAPAISDSGSNKVITENFTFPDNTGIKIINNYIFVVNKDGTNNFICLDSFGEGNDIRNVSFNPSNENTYLHPYKDYVAYYIFNDNLGNNYVSENAEFHLKNDHETLKIIKSSGDIVNLPFKIINSNNGEITEINYRDVVKLSKSMRYILIGSNGIKQHESYQVIPFSMNCGNFDIEGQIVFCVYAYNFVYCTFRSLKIKSNDNKSYYNSNNSLKIEVVNDSCKEKLLTMKTPNEITSEFKEIISLTYGIDTYSFFSINDNNLKFTIKIELGRLFNSTDTNVYEKEIILEDFGSIVSSELNDHFSDNSIVEIDVYDENNNCISTGKILSSLQNNNVISVNNGNATDGNHSDQSKYVMTNGADTFILDLGKEYNISKVDIWRRWNPNDINDNNFARYIYHNNFVYGLNNDKEICYKFFDYRSLDIGDNSFETSDGRSFIINNISDRENMPHA